MRVCSAFPSMRFVPLPSASISTGVGLLLPFPCPHTSGRPGARLRMIRRARVRFRFRRLAAMNPALAAAA